MLNLRESEYFENLPKNIQESVMQSGVDFQTEEDLRQFVENLNRP